MRRKIAEEQGEPSIRPAAGAVAVVQQRALRNRLGSAGCRALVPTQPHLLGLQYS